MQIVRNAARLTRKQPLVQRDIPLKRLKRRKMIQVPHVMTDKCPAARGPAQTRPSSARPPQALALGKKPAVAKAAAHTRGIDG